MHQTEIDRWSRRDSFIHRLDARGKIVSLVLFLAILTLVPANSAPYLWLYAVIPLAGLRAAGIPLSRALVFSSSVLPFVFPLSAAAWFVEGPWRALALLQKSVISALGAVLLVGTTPLPRLGRGLLDLGAPKFLILVIQFLYRYLFVVSEQAQHMRLAAASRGAHSASRYHLYRLRAAGGAVAMLFARSHQRAEAAHRAMLARGFTGRFPLMENPTLKRSDLLTTALLVIVTLIIREVLVLLSS